MDPFCLWQYAFLKLDTVHRENLKWTPSFYNYIRQNMGLEPKEFGLNTGCANQTFCDAGNFKISFSLFLHLLTKQNYSFFMKLL